MKTSEHIPSSTSGGNNNDSIQRTKEQIGQDILAIKREYEANEEQIKPKKRKKTPLEIITSEITPEKYPNLDEKNIPILFKIVMENKGKNEKTTKTEFVLRMSALAKRAKEANMFDLLEDKTFQSLLTMPGHGFNIILFKPEISTRFIVLFLQTIEKYKPDMQAKVSPILNPRNIEKIELISHLSNPLILKFFTILFDNKDRSPQTDAGVSKIMKIINSKTIEEIQACLEKNTVKKIIDKISKSNNLPIPFSVRIGNKFKKTHP